MITLGIRPLLTNAKCVILNVTDSFCVEAKALFRKIKEKLSDSVRQGSKTDQNRIKFRHFSYISDDFPQFFVMKWPKKCVLFKMWSKDQFGLATPSVRQR